MISFKVGKLQLLRNHSHQEMHLPLDPWLWQALQGRVVFRKSYMPRTLRTYRPCCFLCTLFNPSVIHCRVLTIFYLYIFVRCERRAGTGIPKTIRQNPWGGKRATKLSHQTHPANSTDWAAVYPPPKTRVSDLIRLSPQDIVAKRIGVDVVVIDVRRLDCTVRTSMTLHDI